MTGPKFLDTPVNVEAHLLDDRLHPRTLTWRERTYTVVTVGRQWRAEDGTHILIELHDGSRMELRLSPDLGWRLQRYWPPRTVV